MKYFKDNNGNVYAYNADGSQDEYIKDGLISITEDEAMYIINPPLTKDELIKEAGIKKDGLLYEVEAITKLWQTQLVLGIILDSDKERLTAWMRYAQALSAIDINMAPDISWPVRPEV
ncbi:phage tail protein [Salmonella enterica]|nr:phage tail protein [Salmonella enterica]EAU1443680.1 phage tail protein [Salmonella enterica]